MTNLLGTDIAISPAKNRAGLSDLVNEFFSYSKLRVRLATLEARRMLSPERYGCSNRRTPTLRSRASSVERDSSQRRVESCEHNLHDVENEGVELLQHAWP